MFDPLSSLIPLILGSALVPIQIIVTILLLRSSHGKITAVAWIAGMTTARLMQGIVFGLILGNSSATNSGTGPGTLVSGLLLVVAVLFYLTAAKQLLGEPDDDAPPPRWLALMGSVTPAKAFLLGAALLLLSAKFWVFTLGAIAVIAEADLGQPVAVVTFGLFVLLAESVMIALVGVAYAVPDRAAVLLDRTSAFLTRWNRVIMVSLGAVFGTWFLIKSLHGLGII
jgi:hypothetical protein